jgi:nicotinate-nucleotide adenylyltransferase
MHIGLFFGSFNPVHNGHIILAQYMQQHYLLNEVWLVISPKSPFKTHQHMLHHHERLHLIQLAVDNIPHLKPCTIEFDLPEPHYTIHTLSYLFEAYPQHTFSIIMGKDNLYHFHKWKNYEQILKQVTLLVYPRLHAQASMFDNHPRVTLTQAPVIELSSSAIRACIKSGKIPSAMLHPNVWEEIEKSGHYRN